MSTTPTPARPTAVGGHAGSTDDAAANLERFWPSRRGHAFDEFCR